MGWCKVPPGLYNKHTTLQKSVSSFAGQIYWPKMLKAQQLAPALHPLKEVNFPSENRQEVRGLGLRV
jgi:hypothetical protein